MENSSKLKNFLKSLRLNESRISTVLGGLVIVVVGILIYNYFSNVNKAVVPQSEEVVNEGAQLTPEGLPATHTVAAGEHLWMIAEKYYGSGYNWVDIAKENQLVSPNLIMVGQVLIIPKAAPITVGGATKTPVNQVILGSEYTVVKGDSLWKIAVRAYGDGYRWPEIWQANKDKIVNPGLIEIDTVLTLPR